jgi:hypothetical protein
VKHVPVGTKVTYHGSITRRHGDYVVSAVQLLDADRYYSGGIAYVLHPAYLDTVSGQDRNNNLYRVRRTSFTVVS